MDFPNQQPVSPPQQPIPGAPTGGVGTQPTPPAPGAPIGGAMQPPAGLPVQTPGATTVPITSGVPMGSSAQPMGAGPMPPQQQPLGQPTSGEVYTMPEKFLQGGGGEQSPDGKKGKEGKKKGKTWTWILIIVIVLAIAGIVAGVAYYVLNGLPAKEEPQPNAVNNVQERINEQQNNQNNVNDNTNNANENINNVNVNADDNANVNTNNVNVNDNDNTNDANVNTNNANDNTNSNVNVTTSKDTDGDSLTNEEEKIFGTKADKPDSDNDGYNDGVEVLAGYDPNNAESSGKLGDSSLVEQYKNKDYKYSILYPSDWVMEEVSESKDSEVFFTPSALDTAGQFFEVLVEDNPTGFTALDWYLDQQPSVTEDELETITSFDGLEGIISPDGYTTYYANDDYVYALTYQYGSSKEVYFNSTFEMVVKSFIITKSSKKKDATAETNSNETVEPVADDSTNVNANSAVE